MSQRRTPDDTHPALQHLRGDILAMRAYAPGEQVQDCIKLNTNECAWEPSPAVMETLGRIADHSLRLYPDPVSRRLRQAAAERWGLTPDQVLAGNGSDDCLTIIYRAFLSAGQRLACPWPTYGLYDTLASLQGAEIVRVPYVRGTDGSWKLPPDLLEHGAKMVVVANPNNPSATLVPTDELRRLADRLDGILVVDEAYVDFAVAEGLDATMLSHLSSHPNLVVLRTFSKSYSLAGARLGLLFAAAPLIAQLMKVKDSYNVNVITQALGIAALQDVEYHGKVVRSVLAERRRLERELRKLGWAMSPSAANFVLCKLGPRAEEVYGYLKQNGVLVRWWGTPELREHIRITVGKPHENDLLLHLLREFLSQ